MTPSEKLTVYGTENPPTLQLKCHEKQHQVDAEAIADLLTERGFLRPTNRHRFVAWIAVYLANHIDGYEANLLEERAREMCKDVPDIPPPNQPASEKSGE